MELPNTAHESSKRNVERLVEKFDKIVEEQRYSKYNEEMTKKACMHQCDFLDG